MNYSYTEELEQENEQLRKELWILSKGKPKALVKHNLYDKVVEYIINSKALNSFCYELEKNQSSVDVRDIRMHISYSKPKKNEYVWHKYKDGTATREDISIQEEPYPELRQRSQNLSKRKIDSNTSEYFYDD